MNNSQNNNDMDYQMQQQEQQSVLDYMQSLGILQSIKDTIYPPSGEQEQIDIQTNALNVRIKQQFPFTDPLFTPSEDSLTYKKNDKKFANISWRRLKNIYSNPTDYSMMKNAKNIDFKKSAIINDGYFISALNILSQKLSPIIRIFEYFELNQTGIYGCWINIQGQWKLIVVDDNFPCRDNKYVFSTCTAGLWILILQKCLAKAYQSYNSIHGGIINYCLTDLTGCPTEIKEQHDKEDWWGTLNDWFFNRGYLAFVESDRVPNSKDPLQQGLSFSVLDLQEIDYGNGGQKDYLIMLKSPQQSIVYKGQWNYSSSKWTQDIRQKLNVQQYEHDDGTFWVNLKELQDSFIAIGSCKIHDNYQYSWFNLDENKEKSKNKYIIKMQIKTQTHIYFRIHQQDERIIKNSLYEHSAVRMLLAKTYVQPNGLQSYEFINGVYDFGREVTLEEFLDPGEYVFTIEVADQQIQEEGKKTMEKFQNVLSFYAENLPDNVEVVENMDILDLQKKIIKNMTLNKPQPSQKTRTYEQNGEPNIKIYNDMIYGLIYFYYINQGSKKLREQVTMTHLENLQIQSPYTDSNNFQVQLNPNSDAIVIYKYTRGENFSFNSSIKAALDNIPNKEFTQQEERPSLRNSKLSRIDNAQVLQELQSKNSYNNVDMLRFMRENANMVKRIWDDQEIQVMVYNFQHIEGAVIMIMNFTDHTYEEVMVFEVENLSITTVNQATLEDNAVRLILNPYDHTFVFLTTLNKRDPFGYKTRSYYKYYIE